MSGVGVCPSACVRPSTRIRRSRKLVSATGTIDNGNVSADQLQVLLQGAGECLVDNVEVLHNSVNLITNSTFEVNTDGWVAEGTQSLSSQETTEGFGSNRSFHVRAVDRGDNQINRLRILLSSALASGTTYRVYTGGTCTGGQEKDGLYTGGVYSGGTLRTTFVSSGMVQIVQF